MHTIMWIGQEKISWPASKGYMVYDSLYVKILDITKPQKCR
jgi:hypothetical protein